MTVLTQRGMDGNQALGFGQAVAGYVEDYSSHPPIVYQRVLKNAFKKSDDQDWSMTTARNAAARAAGTAPTAKIA